jgi:hypothetical protein
MLFSTEYPAYLDPIDDEHELRPNPLLRVVQKLAKYVGEFFAMLFVVAFTGLELLFVVALAMLVMKGWTNWESIPSLVQGVTQAEQAWVE